MPDPLPLPEERHILQPTVMKRIDNMIIQERIIKVESFYIHSQSITA